MENMERNIRERVRIIVTRAQAELFRLSANVMDHIVEFGRDGREAYYLAGVKYVTERLMARAKTVPDVHPYMPEPFARMENMTREELNAWLDGKIVEYAKEQMEEL